MKRSIRFASFALVLLVGAGAHAQGAPNIDRYLRAPAATAPAAAAVPAANGFVASTDSQRGVPTFFWADPALSGPAAGLAGAGSEERALAFVRQNAGLYGLSSAALAAAYVREVHDTGRGGIIVIFGQRMNGIEVFQTEMKVLLDRAGGLVAIGGNLHGGAAPRSKGAKQAFSLGAAQAIAQAAGDAFEAPIQASDLKDLKQEKAGYRYFGLLQSSVTKSKKLAFATPARAKKVFYPMPDRLVPAYYLEVDAGRATGNTSELYGYVISAENGEILMRRSLTSDAAYKYRVWADATAPFTPTGGPQTDYAPHPTGLPDGSVPAFVPPLLVTMDGFNTPPGGPPDPWLGPAAADTTGNNVEAYADLADPDGFTPGSDVHATPTGALQFDRTYDVTLGPAASQTQIMAATTQLFYVTNWLHDYWYDSGFNEAAGNAQALNFGRGGVEGDSLKAEAQDNSGTDNANMTTPADGARPRMQMYVWDGVDSSTVTVQPLNLSPSHQAASFGPASFNVTATLVLADDGTGPNPNDACQTITNNVSGKIALIERGGMCTIESKVKRAQQAGAAGALIANNNGNGPSPMNDDVNTNGVTIGSFGISQADGNTLKQALASGAALTATIAGGAIVERDGSIDNEIVAHEWGHYLHQRLVACGSEQCGGESEGWADFDALLMRVHEGDNVATGTYGLAIYSTATLGDSGYFGIRRFPYTRDKAKNGLTLKHVTNNVALPPGPQQPAAPDNWEPHNVGEVWATMLFQAYTALLQSGGHPFVEAKRRMADYVVAGMKLAPANPTITEQRDGVLAAAAAADPADFALLAQGFADRGAGTCAVAPPRNSSTGSGVVEDFTISGRQELASATLDDSVTTCDGDGILDGGEVGKLHVEVRNTGAAVLAGTKATVTSSTAGITFPNGGVVTLPGIAPFQTATADVDVAASDSVAALTKAKFTIKLENAAACNASVSSQVTIRVQTDDLPNDTTTETVDSDKAPWIKWGAPGYESLTDDVWSRDEQASGNVRFYGQNFPSHSDTALESPDLVVGAAALVVTFAHAHDFESSPQNPGQADTRWDGGLVEITSDGGATWKDVSGFANPGYNGVIANVPDADNPLADRPAFVGRNPAWPSTNTVTLNLGNGFAGKTVKIRFRIGTDAAAGVPDYLGWYLDNIAVQGITNKPFRTVKGDAADCPVGTGGSGGTGGTGGMGGTGGTGGMGGTGNMGGTGGTGGMGGTGGTGGNTGTGGTGNGGNTGTGGAGNGGNTGTGGAGNGGNTGTGGAGNGGTTTTDTTTSTGTTTDTTADGGGGSGGAGGEGGTGGKDLIVTACTCETVGSSGPSQSSAFLAPLFGAAAFLIRRRRRAMRS
jgi:hypothetical protein